MAKKEQKNHARDNGKQSRAVALSGAAALKFPHALGANDNFNIASMSQFIADPASCVRELVQNSLDAALVDMEEDKAKIRFTVETVDMKHIPGIDSYRAAFDAAVKQRTNNNQTDNVIGGIREFYKKEKVEVLFIADNGIGFNKERLGAMLGDGASYKENEGSSGAFGNGHLTTFALSHLRYIFYGGVLKNGETTYSGHAILASHASQGETRSKDGYFVRDIIDGKVDHNRFEFGEEREMPGFLKPHMEKIQNEWGHGALVAVVSFNNFGSEEDISDIILREAALNFFVAISEKHLEVEVNAYGKSKAIAEGDLRDVLFGERDKKRSSRTGFPSGSRIWRAFETFKDGKRDTIKTSHGDIAVHFREKVEGRKVAICRNGMWITGDIPNLLAQNFADRVGFDALLLIDHQISGEAHRLLKLAETPLHNEIQTKCIKLDDDRKALKKILGEIRVGIKNLVSEKNDESFDPDIFPIQIAGTIDRGRQQRSHGSIKTMGSRGAGARSGKSRRTGRRSGRISRSGRVVSVKSSARRVEAGKLEAVFLPQDNYEDVEMQLLLDGGKDITCAGSEVVIVPIKNVSIEKQPIDDTQRRKDDSGNTVAVRLGEWVTGRECHVSIEYESPADEREHALSFNFASRRARAQNNEPEQNNV